MLPTINLALTGAPDVAGTDSGRSAGLTLSGDQAGSFADLLRVPVPVLKGEPAGNLLPLSGELLPVEGGADNVAADDLMLGGRAQTEVDEALAAANDLSVELWSAGNESAIALPVDGVLPPPVVVSPMPQGLRVAGETLPSSAAISGFVGETNRDVWQQEFAPVLRTVPADDSLSAPRAQAPLSDLPTTSLFSAAVADAARERLPLGSSATAQNSPPVALPGMLATPAPGANVQLSPAPAAPLAAVPGIEVALGDDGWADALGQRVLLMTGQRQTAAEIRLTPAELGPIRVSIALDDGAANVTFTAQHAPAREAIESALPRLREMFGENGVALGDANVSEHAERREDTDGRLGWAAEDAADRSASRGDSPDHRPAARSVAVGLIDTYV